ncbi:MAG: hypothetical protein Q8L84_05435 [Hyphomonas sp.]|nr:hypothetical protein [Hyphomonas sp.]
MSLPPEEFCRAQAKKGRQLPAGAEHRRGWHIGGQGGCRWDTDTGHGLQPAADHILRVPGQRLAFQIVVFLSSTDVATGGCVRELTM